MPLFYFCYLVVLVSRDLTCDDPSCLLCSDDGLKDRFYADSHPFPESFFSVVAVW